MLILIANIGGAAAYSNVLDELYNINRSGLLPDMCFIQECGNDACYPGLQPYFNSHITNNNTRLHISDECVPISAKTIPGTSIITATFDLITRRKTKQIKVIVGYRESVTSKTKFLSAMEKEIKSTPPSTSIWLGGDFNIKREEAEIENFIVNNKFTELANVKHKHRTTDMEHQIDYIVTNQNHIKSVINLSCKIITMSWITRRTIKNLSGSQQAKTKLQSQFA